MKNSTHINDEGKLVIDMAEADALWDTLGPDQKYQAMEAMFMPMLENVKRMKAALTQIASMTDPDDMEQDRDGLTEWGCTHPEAVEMAYENCITIAQLALGDVI